MLRQRYSPALWLLSLVAAGVGTLAQAAPAAEKLPAPSKYAIFMQGKRIGTATNKYAWGTLGAKKVLLMDSDMNMTLQVLTTVEQKVRMRHTLDMQGRPLAVRSQNESLGRTTQVDAKFFPNRVECQIDAGGTKSTRTVPIPKGVTLLGDPEMGNKQQATSVFKIGQKKRYHIFDPTTLAIHSVDMHVLRKEAVKVNGKSRQAFVVRSTNAATGESTQWITPGGELLIEESKFGIRVVREDLGQVAPPTASAEYTPPQDFAVATAIQVDTKIPNPRELKSLEVKITGVPEAKFVLADGRQQVAQQKVGAQTQYTYTLTAVTPADKSGTPAAEPDSSRWLKDAPYLGSGNLVLQRQAKIVVGGETDRLAIAKKIRDFVHKHMKEQRNIGVPRSAPEILKSRDGVCRDYATLFTALARASGVPTRICTGIVYHKDRFFYHAWAECQVGTEDVWVPFDPTLPMDFVDATHIKFAHGDPTDMYQAVPIVGRIKVEVVSFK